MKTKLAPSAPGNGRRLLTYINAPDIALFVTTIGFLLVALFLLNKRPLIADEVFHFDQISRFIEHKWTLNPDTTTVPGYHLLMAAGAVLLKAASFRRLRILQTGFGILAILLFFFCARQFNPRWAVRRTQQWMVLPILFPFFFILYTDVAGTAFVLASILFLKWRRNVLSGLMGVIGMAVRQTNIVWFLFLPALRLMETSVLDGEVSKRMRSIEWRAILRETWIFLLGIACFIAFVVWNGGVAVGDANEHPFPAFYFGNSYFFLFVSFVLFLPLHVAAFRRLWSFLSPKRSVLLLLGISGFFLLYWLSFTNTHDYNQARYSWWLHNKILLFAVATPMHKALFFIPVVGGLLSLSCMPLSRGAYALLYPFTFLYLAPSWLIEQRYDLVPLTLLMLMRKQEHWVTENLLLVYWLLLSIGLLVGFNRGEFFL